MDNNDIEIAAVFDVSKYINGPKLRSFISYNDKTPLWDGDIFVYNSIEKDNEHFYGRVPVQVKGTKVTEFSEEKISYSDLTRGYLENYRKDGGCIFFVAEVMMNDETQETSSRVFYCELSVAFITALLNKKEDVQQPTFHLIPVPRKKSDFIKIVTDFSDTRYKNLVVRDLDEIEGLEKRIDELLNITNCINKDEYKSFFSTYIANLEAMKREKESIWNEIKENYTSLNSKTPNVVDESIRAEINLHSNYLLSNLYNCLSKWLDKFLVWIPEIIEIASTSKKLSGDDSYHLIYNYAKYLLSQKKYHLIGNYFDRALEISYETSSSDSQWRVAETLYSMAEFHKDLNLYEEAKDEYTEVLDILLPRCAKVKVLNVVINCIYNLTFLYEKLNCPKETMVLFNGLLKSLRLAANDDPYYNWYLFNTLIHLGYFYKHQFQNDEMKKAFEEAQIIYERLPLNQIDLDSEFAADIHMYVGAFHAELNRPEDAEIEYGIALKIYNNLAKANRDAYIKKEAMIHRDLAILFSKTKPKEAEKEFNEALKIYEELAEVNPSAYKGQVAFLHKRLAILFKETKPEEVEKEYNEALKIYEELAEVNPTVYLGDVADILSNLGKLHVNSNSFVDAEKELMQALDIHKAYVTVNPNKYNIRVAHDLLKLSLLFTNDGCHIKEAKQACEESLAILKSLAGDSPEEWTDFVQAAEQMLNTINEKLRAI